jgi:metallo-beta-lactamase superfamily protein
MTRKVPANVALLFSLTAATALAQDANSVIQRAEKAMGDVKSIRYSGTGKLGAVGMNWNPTAPWHITVLTSYTRTIDYPSESSTEEITRTQENPPMPGGEAPFVGVIVEGRRVSGKYAWNQPANANPTPPPNEVRPAPSTAYERGLQIWLTPHGFLQAAARNHATAQAARDAGNKLTTLTFMAGKNKIVGTIDGRNMVTEVKTWIANPVLGDMPVETAYSDYKDFNGVKFPAHIVQKQGGFVTLELTVTNAQGNVENAALQVPEAVLRATIPPDRLTPEKIADGVWLLHGGHNSVLVEFKDFLAVVDAPLNEARSLAVIAQVKMLAPDKPIQYVINTHHHFDHSGGLRTYVAEGATVITHEGNQAFYEWAWKQPRTMEPDKLAENPKEAKFITYQNKYVLTDGSRSVEVHLIIGDNHDEFLSFAYLPKEKLLIEVDDFSDRYITPLSLALWNNLYGNLQRLNLEVETIAPLHGNLTPMSEWLKILRENSGQAQAANDDAASKAAARPTDIDPQSGNRLPLPKREDMNEADRKIFDDIMARQQGGLSSREKERPQVRMYSPGVSKGLEEAHHYLKYEAGLGDRLMTVAVLTTARELANQFEWTQWEEHARNSKDTRYVEPNVIDAIKYCRPVTDLNAKDAAIITLGREMLGARKVSSETFANVLRLFGRRGTVDLAELMALYGATADELVVFDQQLHAGQKPLLPADAKSCGK